MGRAAASRCGTSAGAGGGTRVRGPGADGAVTDARARRTRGPDGGKPSAAQTEATVARGQGGGKPVRDKRRRGRRHEGERAGRGRHSHRRAGHA